MIKQFKFICLSFFISSIGFGQITYEYADFADAGDVYAIKSKFYTPNDNIFLDQFETNWDFSEIIADSIDTIRFVLPETTQFTDSFPNSNLCIIQEDGTLVYINKSESGVQLLGAATIFEEVGIPFVYGLEDVFMLTEFPVTMNDELENSTSFTITETPDNLGIDPDSLGFPVGVDSIRISVNLSDIATIDDFGTVTLPQGTFDCLKEDRLEVFGIGLEVLVFFGWVPVPTFTFSDTTHIYRFLAKEYGYPIAEIYASPDNSVLSISYIYEEPVYTDNINVNSNLKVYPNPATNLLYIESDKLRNQQIISIYNLEGKWVKSIEYNISKPGIDISDFVPGNYFLVSPGNDGNSLINSHFTVVK